MENKYRKVTLLDRQIPKIRKVIILEVITEDHEATGGVFESDGEVKKIEEKRERMFRILLEKKKSIDEINKIRNVKLVKSREEELKKLIVSLEKPVVQLKEKKKKGPWYSGIFNW